MEEKFCVNCKWYLYKRFTNAKHFCTKRLIFCEGKIDIITGKSQAFEAYQGCCAAPVTCQWAREPGWNCGTHGQYYEEKEKENV